MGPRRRITKGKKKKKMKTRKTKNKVMNTKLINKVVVYSSGLYAVLLQFKHLTRPHRTTTLVTKSILIGKLLHRKHESYRNVLPRKN